MERAAPSNVNNTWGEGGMVPRRVGCTGSTVGGTTAIQQTAKHTADPGRSRGENKESGLTKHDLKKIFLTGGVLWSVRPAVGQFSTKQRKRKA